MQRAYPCLLRCALPYLGRDAVKIAFVTAKGENSERAAGRRANADACITKPFSPIKFLENVDWLLV